MALLIAIEVFSVTDDILVSSSFAFIFCEASV
jgi:hypothetical protein